MLVATTVPTVQASGSRAQKPLRSWTVADAAEMASEVPTSPVDVSRCGAPGSKINTTPSQNAIRKRKNMSPASHAVRITAAGCRLAASLESDVRAIGSFLRIIEQNKRQIFAQFETTFEKKIVYLKFVRIRPSRLGR